MSVPWQTIFWADSKLSISLKPQTWAVTFPRIGVDGVAASPKFRKFSIKPFLQPVYCKNMFVAIKLQHNKLCNNSDIVNSFGNNLFENIGIVLIWFLAKKVRKHGKTGTFILHVIQHCGYSKWAERLSEHDGAIIFTIWPLLHLSFVKIRGNSKIYIVGSLIEFKS